MQGISVTAGIVLLALLPGPASAQEPADEDVFRSEIARLELSKPAGWQFQDLEVVAANRAAAKLKDESFQEAMNQLASAPLVVATRHPEPYPTLNPGLQVLVRPLGQLEGISGTEILELVLPTLRAQLEDFELVEEVHETEVDRLPGGRVTARYTVATQDGSEYPTQATIVTVPRGSYLYQFSLSAPPEGPDALTGEVEEVLGSVRFLEKEPAGEEE